MKEANCFLHPYRLIGYALIEAFNRASRTSAVDAERNKRAEEYRARVGQYPSSTGDPSRIRRLDKDGKPFKGKDGIPTKGTRKRSFKQETDNR